MSRLTDAIEALEFDLAKYPGADHESLLNRRLVLRKALDAYGRDCYDGGRHDGMRDVRDTQFEAKRREREAADEAAIEAGGSGA